jgi:hypothetical protein
LAAAKAAESAAKAAEASAWAAQKDASRTARVVGTTDPEDESVASTATNGSGLGDGRFGELWDGQAEGIVQGEFWELAEPAMVGETFLDEDDEHEWLDRLKKTVFGRGRD